MAKKYHLYVVRPEDIPEKEKYFLITAKWCLLYTNRKPPKKNREVKDVNQLPSLAIEWLTATIDQIREEYLKANANDILRRGKEFTQIFENELKAEQEKIEAESNKGKQNA